jgi:hypothetical protein
MNPEKIGDMTLDELTELIEQVVERHLHPPKKDTRSLEEVLDSLDRNRWTPPPGSPSTLQMIREDRDSH